MDVSKLIREVRSRPAIWNQKSTNYYNRDVVTRTWEEISAACDLPYDAVKCKWKHLRDNFRKELKKCLKETGYQSDPERYESGWVWFKSLNFLANQLSAKRLTTQLQADKLTREDRPRPFGMYNEMASQNDDCIDVERTCIETDDSDEDYFNETPNVTFQKRSDVGSKRKRSRPGTGHDETDDTYRPKTVRDETDDTYYFLMSLMRPMKFLPFERQMMARLKMQEVIAKEIAQLNRRHSVYPKEPKGETAASNVTPIISVDDNESTMSTLLNYR